MAKDECFMEILCSVRQQWNFNLIFYNSSAVVPTVCEFAIITDPNEHPICGLLEKIYKTWRKKIWKGDSQKPRIHRNKYFWEISETVGWQIFEKERL